MDLVNICNQMCELPIYILASLTRDCVLGRDYFIWYFELSALFVIGWGAGAR